MREPRWRAGAASCVAVVATLALAPLSVHAQARPAGNEPRGGASLAALLQGRANASDPALEQLVEWLRELRGRSTAAAAGASLARVQTAIDSVRLALALHAPASQITRDKQLAWASLSLADRIIARADAQAAVREAQARAARAQAELKAAQLAVAAAAQANERAEARTHALPRLPEPAK